MNASAQGVSGVARIFRSPVVRLLSAIGIAAVLTFSIFLFMYVLITNRDRNDDQIQSRRAIIPIRTEKPTEVRRKKRVLPKKRKRKDTPKPQDLKFNVSTNPNLPSAPTRMNIPITNTAISGVKVDMSGFGNFSNTRATVGRDQVLMARVRTRPVYPENMRHREISGWVEVGFTVGKTGATKNVKVIRADPPSIFDSAAIRAIKRWKYQPQVEDGKAIEVAGQMIRFTFNIDGSVDG